MAGADRSAKDKEMAAHLKRQGIFHGVRRSSSNADPMKYLKYDLVGTARYRRYLESLRAGRIKETKVGKDRIR